MKACVRDTLLATAAGILALASPAAAATVVRGPYLQTPTPSSMIVRWRTDTPTSSRVAVGAAPGSLTTTVDDPAVVTEHVVRVTGLLPSTQYYYAVGAIAGTFLGDDPDHVFRTPSGGTPAPFRIWSIGDAGFTGPTLNAVRDAFKAYNGASSAADLFLLLGDNAYLTGTDAQYQAAVFDVHAEMLRTTPVYSTFGNHERFSSQDLTQTGPYFDMFSFPTLGEAGGVPSGTESYYAFDYNDVHVVVLDSEDFTPASAGGPMLTWLESDLAAVPSSTNWIIAVWHRPPYSKGLLHDSDVELNEIRMRQYVLPLLEDYGVDLVLCGHSHSYERSYFINGHYGLSTTFTDAFKKDLGDGDPDGDGAYRKAGTGPVSGLGAVYVVNGSGSEVRPATLNHPAHVRGLLSAGSMVVDVDQHALTARFLSSTGSVDDQFRIVKGGLCAASPASGCGTGMRGDFRIRGDGWSWKWTGGTIEAADVGDPTGETDLAVCVYDATGRLMGGEIPHGRPEWKAVRRGVRYRDPRGALHGLRKVRIRPGTPSLSAYVRAKARGAGAGPPATVVTPVTAQLVNVDTGACWSSQFATTRVNQPGRVIATYP